MAVDKAKRKAAKRRYYCNVGLGSFRDDEARLLKAIAYLRRHNG